MIISPIIPIWIMIIICLILLFIIRNNITKLIDFLIILILFIINLRIMIPGTNQVKDVKDLDVIFVIDNTISMLSNDYMNGLTRSDGLKKDCNRIIDQIGAANYEILSFNNSGKIISPFTRDLNIIRQSIDILEPIRKLYARGTNLNISYDLIYENVKNDLDNENPKILFFISDGEITDYGSLQSFSELKNYIDGGAVLGYGSKNGGKMLVFDKIDNKSEYIKDTKTYTDAISKIDENNLKKIASDIGIEYINMNNNDGKNKLNNNIKKVLKISKTKTAKTNSKYYDDTYFYFIVPLIILFCMKFIYIKRSNYI